MKRFYTGIGSRETPNNTLDEMEDLGYILAKQYKYILRSGAAPGADSAFEIGCDKASGDKEIYLPFKGWNNHSSPLFETSIDATEYIQTILDKNHWRNMGKFGRAAHSRNVHQVVGQYLKDGKPNLSMRKYFSKFVVCYTLNGKLKGGTATAIKIAQCLDIPVFNFGNMSYRDILNGIESMIEMEGMFNGD